MSVPAIPPEILQRILDLIEEHETKEQERNTNKEGLPPKHSETLLASHMVSKQFRAYTLRRIYRRVCILLHDTPQRLKLLQDLLVEEANPDLGSFVPFVKEVDIVTVPAKDPIPTGYEQPKVHEEALCKLLQTIARHIAIQNLAILGTENAPIAWKSLPASVQQALQSLMRLPSVSSLGLRLGEIGQASAPLLTSNAHLTSLTLTGYTEDLLPAKSSLPNLECLNVRYLCDFPEDLSLPALRTMNVRNGDMSDSDWTWEVIGYMSKTLERLTVHDDEASCSCVEPIFPDHNRLNIGSFPQLEHFVYSNQGCHLGAMSAAVQGATRFFNTSRPVPNIQAISFSHSLAGEQSGYEESMALNERAWRELDAALASGHYPALKKVCMNVALYQCTCGQGSDPDTRTYVRHEVVRENILDFFCELRQLSVPMEVHVTSYGP